MKENNPLSIRPSPFSLFLGSSSPTSPKTPPCQQALCSSHALPQTKIYSPPAISIHANRSRIPEANPAKYSTRQPGHPVICSNHQLCKGLDTWAGWRVRGQGRWLSPPTPRSDETAKHLLIGQLLRVLILGTHGDQDRENTTAQSRVEKSMGLQGVSQSRVQISVEPSQVTWGHTALHLFLHL